MSTFISDYIAAKEILEDRSVLSAETVDEKKKLMFDLLEKGVAESNGPMPDEFCKAAYEFCQSITNLGHDFASRKIIHLRVDDVVGSEDFKTLVSAACNHLQWWRRLHSMLGYVQTHTANPELAQEAKQEREVIRSKYPQCFE